MVRTENPLSRSKNSLSGNPRGLSDKGLEVTVKLSLLLVFTLDEIQFQPQLVPLWTLQLSSVTSYNLT